MSAKPATTIFPSSRTATSCARSRLVPGPTAVVSFPAVPKLVSSVPSALKRASATSNPPVAVTASPAATILPSRSSARFQTCSSKPPALDMLVVTVPPAPNLPSSSPLGV